MQLLTIQALPYLCCMTISYKWLMDYFQQPIPHEKLNLILNSIGLEVEGYDAYQEIKGSLAGLITGEVLTVEKHPNADRLSVTSVHIGAEKPLQIVCGAPNVAAGQKVIVAPIGVTIYPTAGDPITMKNVKIRSIESEGMICAEDEIGLGTDHNGIKILPPETAVGIEVASLFNTYEDHVISIGLTPNRSDAMSHFGVARDICAWLNHHEGTALKPIISLKAASADQSKPCPIKVAIENTNDCKRYAGAYIADVSISSSPIWMQQRLKAIGQRSINAIVDITNYILHDTGQPLHAFDADKIKNAEVRVKNLTAGTPFKSLDEKERKLLESDLMICDGENNPMCMGGVFGGIDSGVSSSTKNIFLESAWFHPVSIRKTSFGHQLRTDAAMHFEKSVDIGQTLEVLKKAAALIVEIAGGVINGGFIDACPSPIVQPVIKLNYDYVKKLSGKSYAPTTIRQILVDMGFESLESSDEFITVKVPTHKTDVHIPADLVEEIMRIDGFDNIEIPKSIYITPATSNPANDCALREKISAVLNGVGFSEMLNNSITNSKHYTENELHVAVKMLNNLSSELDMLRLTMLETGLETVSKNLNHRNDDLKLFEFGKTYTHSKQSYAEADHLALFTTGVIQPATWNNKEMDADLYFLKGVLNALQNQSGINNLQYQLTNHEKFDVLLEGKSGDATIVQIGKPTEHLLRKFDIKVPVWYADIQWNSWFSLSKKHLLKYKEISKFPSVQRDLSFIANTALTYGAIENALSSLSIHQLKGFRLFDIFKSDKLGKDKQSMAMNFTFMDETKTMKDEEIEKMMKKITHQLEKEFQIEIRK